MRTERRKVETAVLYRRMMKIKWTGKIINEKVFSQRIKNESKIILAIRKRRCDY